MPRLILNPGQADERVFELKQGPNSIGRTKDNFVFVLHKSLSREHARIVLSGEQALVEDLGSKNGTFVDGTRVERRELAKSHLLKFGDVTFSFVAGNERVPLPPARHAAPSIVYDLAHDPLRRSLEQLLGAGRAAHSPGATALHIRATAPSERNHEKLEILLKVSELLSSPAPIDEVLAKVLDLGFDILDIDRGTIVMLVDGKPTPRVAKARPGVPEHQSYSRQIVGQVLEGGMAALYSDARSDARLIPDGSILQQSIFSAMCAPLRAGKTLLGALYVDNVTQPDRFAEEDLHFLSAFANQAAIAIHNASLSSRLAQEAVTRNTLMRFFPPTAIEAIVQGRDSLAARETEATALFCDLSGYTEMSSRMSPKAVIELLNHYFPVMADIVFKHEGMLEKYIGDALLAVWGAPFSHPDDAARAVRAAVDMQRAVHGLSASGKLPPGLAVHIGVKSGIVAAGNIGSQQYLQYATIGDATNVASRICNVAAEREILIDANTAGRLDTGFALEALAPVVVKGKAEPLELFRVGWQG